jgi:AraC-like DNA-binding protein
MALPQIAPGPDWSRLPITSVEDVQEAVLGAGLDAVQLSRGPMHGSLAFATSGRMAFSTGHLTGRVSLTGALSETMTTLGVGIRIAPGSRHWMNEVETGGVGIFRAGDTHEAIYLPGTIYACVTLPDTQLEEIAADMGLVLDDAQLGGSRISRRRLSTARLATLQRAFVEVHTAGAQNHHDAAALGRFMLECLIQHVAREPRPEPGLRDMGVHSRIVARAQNYIRTHLTDSISISAIARASFASQSTLYRAFHEVLDETPQSFIRKLRLNRIRHDLATEEEARCTITILANKWGVGELGRFAGWYRELFGELPSQTRAQRVAIHEVLASHKIEKNCIAAR